MNVVEDSVENTVRGELPNQTSPRLSCSLHGFRWVDPSLRFVLNFGRPTEEADEDRRT